MAGRARLGARESHVLKRLLALVAAALLLLAALVPAAALA
jgi:hypothetical protein